MAKQERHWTKAWTIASICVVALTLLLAAVGTFVAIRQTHSLARLRIADLRVEAQRIRDAVHADLLPQIERFLRRAADNLAPAGAVDPFQGGPPPEWISEVYLYDPDASAVMLDRWTRSGPHRWRKLSVRTDRTGGLDPETASILSQLLAPFLAAQFAPPPEPVQFVYDVVDQEPFSIALMIDADGARGWSVVAARIDLPGLIRNVLDRQMAGDRVGVEQVLPGGASTRRRALPWHEDLAPLAPFLWMKPTPVFVDRQFHVVRTQTALFIVGMLLVMGALAAIIWGMWRVLQREIALSQLKQAFVADVSHELKTPLSLIRLFAETLLSGRVPTEEKKREYYEVITRESDRLTHLINNILDFARIDAGRKRYELQPADIGELVRETYEAYRLQLDHDGFEHYLVIADDLPEIACDRDAIAQALINLINNAVKYTEGDDKFLGIDVSRETRRGGHGVLISVSDRGIGIKPEDRNHLFTGFYRANDERVRQRRGAGLGLALVKHIVDAHGGIVDVESRLIKGSTFRIFLPAEPPRRATASADLATDDPG